MDKSNAYIRFDWAMKHMLREKSNFEILESESNQENDIDKFNLPKKCFLNITL